MASGLPDMPTSFGPAQMAFHYVDTPTVFPTGRGPGGAGVGQIIRSFGLWHATYEWVDLEPDDFDEIYTFFDYYGQHTPFTVYNAQRPLPRGLATPAELDNLVIRGPNQKTRSILIDGAPANRLIFKRGDMVGFASTGEAFRVRANCTSDGAGVATLEVNQYPRRAPGDNTDVVVSYVPVRMRNTRPMPARVRPWELSSFTVELQEFPPYQ